MASARRPAVALLALSIVLLLVPGVLAEYEGPGHSGMVPLGDGGLLLGVLPDLGTPLTHVEISGLPRDACRIDLVGLEDGPRVGLAWEPGNTTAYVYAEPGARDAWFRVDAHWVWDVKGECTIEHNEAGVVYHDPRGRPYVDLRFPEPRIVFTPTTGAWSRIEVPIHNAGTVAERADFFLEQQRDHWRLRNATASANVDIGPGETYRFSFELLVPASEPARLNLLVLRAVGQESGIQDRVILVLDLQQGAAPPEETPSAAPAELPPYEPPVEAPLPSFLLVLAVLAVWLVRRRAHGAVNPAPSSGERRVASSTFRRSVAR